MNHLISLPGVDPAASFQSAGSMATGLPPRGRSTVAVLATLLWLSILSTLASLHAAEPAVDIVPNRTAPSFVPAPAQPTAVFSAVPTAEEIGKVRAFEELLVPMSGPANDAAENRALADALATYHQARQTAGPSNAAEVDVKAFERFVARYPRSVWNASLLTNLGVEYYGRGAISQALAAWRQAWMLGKGEKSPAVAAVVDRALGELSRMLARLGRVEELQVLVDSAADRQVSGLGTEAYHGARGGLWNMLNHPEESFKCGPWALDSILTQANPAHPYRLKLKQVASTKDGVALSEVADLAKETGLSLVPMQRVGTTGAVPVPAVVHWKLGHYGALLRYENGRYLLQDPTFGNSQWITQATLDQEASGSFLIPAPAPGNRADKSASATLAANWKAIDPAEAGKIYGKGFPSAYPPPPPPPPPEDPPEEDPPVYTPPVFVVPTPGNSSGSSSGFGNASGGPSSGSGPSGNGPGRGNGGGSQGSGGQGGRGGGSGTTVENSALLPFLFRSIYQPFDADGSNYQSDPEEERLSDQLRQAQQEYEQQQQEERKRDNIFNTGGMAFWNINLSEVDLRLLDTPLFYRPPVGPDIRFQVSYEQREANQPATLSFANLGNKWNLNWITTLNFDSNNAYVNSGESGIDTFAGFTATSTASGMSNVTRTKIVRFGTNYQLVSPDGSLQAFNIHDGSGRYYMTQKVDPQGNAVNLGYDSQYRLVTVTDTIGQVSTLTYGNVGDPLKITKITDPFGRTALFAYDASNHLAQITDAAGLTSQFAYASDFVQTLTTGYGATNFSSTENGLDRTLLITLPDGSQEMAQSLGGSTAGVAFSDPASLVPQGVPVFNNYLVARNTSFWDRKAMLEAPGDPTKARIYHYLHGNNLQKSGVLESVKLPFENRVWYYYQGQQQPGFVNTDGQGMLDLPTRIGRVLDDGTTQLAQRSYNALGYLTQSIDPVGRTTNYVYDANGIDLLQVRQVTGVSSSELRSATTYNARHQPLTVTDTAGQTTKYTYNALGQRLTAVDAKGQTTTYVYGANNYLRSVTGPRAGSTGQTSFTYDAYGRPRTSTDALGYTLTFAYDNLNRLANVSYPDGTSRQRTYTLLDLTDYKDRLNRHTTYAYDAFRELVATTDPLNRTTKYTYCRCGALNGIIDPLGQTTRFDYDVQSRPTAKRYPDGSTTTYAYEATTSRLKSATDASGQVTNYAYTPDNRLNLVSYSNALKATPAVRLVYDSSYPRLVSLVDGFGMSNYSYNPVTTPPTLGAGRFSAVQTPCGRITYGYDELGRLNYRTVDGTVETATYNAAGAPATVTDSTGVFAYGYLNNTRLLSSITRPNQQTTALSYSTNQTGHLLQQIQHKRADGSPLSITGLGYDALPKITTLTQQSDAAVPRQATLGYDAADQLTSVTQTNPAASYGYTYDPAANRLTETVNGSTTNAAYNSLNELQSVKPPPTADRTLEWNAANRLVAINYPGTGNRTEWGYDGFGRPVQVVEKNGSTVTSTKRFLWDGLRLRAEKDVAGLTIKRFYPLGMQIVSGSNSGSYYYTFDQLGSIRELSDAAGAVRVRYDYDPWGRRTKLSGDLDADFGFGGRYQHAASGLMAMPFRFYDPSTGRWLNRDPAGEARGFNLFRYVDNDPVNFTD